MGWTEKSFGLKQKRFGLKKVFLGWKTFGLKKSIVGWKIKSNTPKEKKEWVGEKWGRLKQKNRSAKTETEKGGGTEAKKKKKKRGWNRKKRRKVRHWSWTKERAGTENFSAFIFLQIFSEKLWWIHLCWI